MMKLPRINLEMGFAVSVDVQRSNFLRIETIHKKKNR